MATAKKAAPKPGTKEYRPAEGICRHRHDGTYDCGNTVRPATETRKASVWCEHHIVAERAASAKKPKAPAKPKADAKPKSAGSSPATTKAARDRRLAKANGGALRPQTPPTRPMGSGAVARIPSAPENYAPGAALVAPSN